MSGTPFVLPRYIPVNSTGRPYPLSTLTFYQAGTTTLATIYTTSALSVAHSNPLTSNSAGLFPAIYLSPTIGYDYKVVLKNASGSTLWTEDTIPAEPALSQATIGAALYPRNAAEIAAAVTPVDYSYPPLNVLRYALNTSPGVTDVATGFNNAVAVAEAGDDRTVRIPAGDYLLGAVVAPSAECFGLRFIGDGSQTTTLTASHTAGPVLQINRSGSQVIGLNITATAARTAAAAGTNYGLLVEAPDASGKAVAHFKIEDVIIQDQPSHGYVNLGPSTNGVIVQLLTRNNGGHGTIFDTGILNSRTNKGACGQMDITDLWSYSNGGNGLVIGNAADTTAAGVPYRFNISNLELVSNASDAAVRLSHDEAWIHSEDTLLMSPAFGPQGLHGGLRFSGRDLEIHSPRFITCVDCVSFGADPVAGQFTQRIRITNFRALNTAQDPAFVIEDTTNVSNVRVETATEGNVTTWFTAGAVQCTVNLTEPIVAAVKVAETQAVSNSTTLVNDDQLYIPIAASERVTFECSLRVAGGSADHATADVKVAFTAPAGATIRWSPVGSLYVTTADAVAAMGAEITEGTGQAFGASSAGTRHLHLTGRCVNSTTAGNLQLQWAQNTGTVVDTKILEGSYLKVIRANSLV